MEEFEYQKLPVFAPAMVEQCRQRGDYRPMLFEWYRHVALTCNEIASIRADSPAFMSLSPSHYAVLVGLLNRCSRLMLSNVALSSGGRFGETTRLIDRCIAESAVKVRWLSAHGGDGFIRYLADGLKNDLILKAEIQANIAKRSGVRLVIEDRMLESIDRCVLASGLSEQQISGAKRLPDLRSMLDDFGVGSEAYTILQRMGSHSVHGTWADLVANYLQIDDSGGFRLRDHDVPTHHNQFVFVILLVLGALKAFLLFMAGDPSDVEPLVARLDQFVQGVTELDKEDYGHDFEPVADSLE